jgi:hypothetical protein
VVTEGATVSDVPVEPVFHEYEDAPEAVTVADCPSQTVACETVMVGDGRTETVETVVAEHPEVVPVTE